MFLHFIIINYIPRYNFIDLKLRLKHERLISLPIALSTVPSLENNIINLYIFVYLNKFEIFEIIYYVMNIIIDWL